MSPFNQTLLVEDVPVGQVALKRHPRIVFDSEREIMKVVDNEEEDDGDDGIPQLQITGRLESPQMLLLPPPSPPPNPSPPTPPAKPSAATGEELIRSPEGVPSNLLMS